MYFGLKLYKNNVKLINNIFGYYFLKLYWYWWKYEKGWFKKYNYNMVL